MEFPATINVQHLAMCTSKVFQLSSLALLSVVSLLFASGALGCNSEKKSPGANSPAGAAAKSSGAGADGQDAPEIPITVVGRQEYEQILAKHRGRVVLVDHWATFCGPCMKQFPHTVELWEKNRDRGLDVISLSFDEPSNLEPVRKFLADKGAHFENLVSKVGSGETSAEEFDFDGALPHYALYGRDGKLVKRLSPSDPTATFRLEMVDEAIEELLSQPTP